MSSADFNNPLEQKDFRVLYHKEIIKDENLLQQDFLKIDDDDFYMPYDYGKEFSISFEKKEQFIGITYYRFKEIIPNWLKMKNSEKLCMM